MLVLCNGIAAKGDFMNHTPAPFCNIGKSFKIQHSRYTSKYMSKQQRLLFLCTGNYYRSRFSEEYFIHFAEKNGLPWTAYSAGLSRNIDELRNPGPISRYTLEKLKELEITPKAAERFPVSVDQSLLDDHHHTIAVCDREHRPMVLSHFPDYVHKIEFWDVEDIEYISPTVALHQLQEYLDRCLEKMVSK